MNNDEGSIPNLITLSQIPSNMMMKIESDLLDPVVFNQGTGGGDGFCRFQLQNKGILHSHSKIFLSVEANASVNSGYFNPVTGVGQVIKKAVLKIGNKTLNEVSSWDSLYAVKSSLIKNENNVEREFYTTGRFMNHNFVYDDGSKTQASKYGLDTGWEYEGTGANVPVFAEMDGASPAESPTFSVDLSDLFPFLKVNQLPLYMMKEPVTIELTFYPTAEGDRIQIASGDDTGKAALIRQNDLKFCADYVYYGEGDEMARFAEANKDMTFSFVDYRAVETTVNASSLSDGGIIRNLGMANRVVSRVVTTLPDTDLTETHIVTRSNSIAPALTGTTPGTVKYNLRYNDRYEFSTDVENTARLMSIFTDAEGVPFITRSEFSHERNDVTSNTLNGRAQNVNLNGTFFNLGTKLTNGRVGQRGLEIHLSGTFPASVDTMKNFCEYLRVARLSDGYLEVFNA